jgi:hypothetical protein
MSDVREAAGRLREAAERYTTADFSESQPMYLDGLEVCRAYLAEHPADDDEPVTEDWLREIGFTGDMGMGQFRLDSDFHIQAWETQTWSIETKDTSGQYYGCRHELDIGQPKTRRDVRNLLAALGIELK